MGMINCVVIKIRPFLLVYAAERVFSQNPPLVYVPLELKSFTHRQLEDLTLVPFRSKDASEKPQS